MQRMAEAPDTEKVMAALPAAGPLGDPADLVRTATTIEQVRTEADEADGGIALGRRGDLRGLPALQRAAAGGALDPRPDLRRPDPLDRLDVDLAGRPPLHLPAARGRTTPDPLRSASSPLHRPRCRPRPRRRCSPPAARPRPPRRRPTRAWSSTGPRRRPCRWSNQQGKAVSLAALRGKVVVLAPFLSLCQDECPLVTGAFISLAARPARRRAGPPRRLRRGHRRPGPRHGGPPGRLPEGVRGRLGAVDRHAGQRRRVLEAVRRRVPDRARGATAEDGLVHRPAADLRRRPHRRLHPHRAAPGASASSTPPRRTRRARSTRSCAGSSTTAACTTCRTRRRPTGPRPTP